MQTITRQQTFVVYPEGRGFRVEPEAWNGRQLAAEMLKARIGVACFGRMKMPEFFGSFSVTGMTEAEALAKAETVEAEYRGRIEAGVNQLAQCATCCFNENCFRMTMAAKQYTS